MKHLIAISGWKRSGKDTVGSILRNKIEATRLSFADALKVMVSVKYDIPMEMLHSQDLKETPLLNMPVTPKDSFSLAIIRMMSEEFRYKDGMKCGIDLKLVNDSFIQHFTQYSHKLYWTPRALLILEGSIARSTNPNFWIDKAINGLSSDTNYVITDVRYRNEIDSLKEKCKDHKVISIRVNRFDTCDSTDPSERDLDNYKFDYVINNKSTLDDLESQINDILEDIQDTEAFKDL